MTVPVSRSEDADGFPIWAENWPTLMAWLDLETQWRVTAGAKSLIWTGLDYAAVEIVLRRRKHADHVFDDLQEMEKAALKAFAEMA